MIKLDDEKFPPSSERGSSFHEGRVERHPETGADTCPPPRLIRSQTAHAFPPLPPRLPPLPSGQHLSDSFHSTRRRLQIYIRPRYSPHSPLFLPLVAPRNKKK